MQFKSLILAITACVLPHLSFAQSVEVVQQVVDLTPRPGVTLRSLAVAPLQPKAVVVLLAGGNGGLQMYPNGTTKSLGGNFLIRTRHMFADNGLAVLVMDAPSDRLREPFLYEFRRTAEHATDLSALVQWARSNYGKPVFLVGTSRGSESAVFGALNLTGDAAPNGIVLSSTKLRGESHVLDMGLDKISQPVLLVQHEKDTCAHSLFVDVPELRGSFTGSKKVDLISFSGGSSTGDVCQSRAYHGYNGIEADVVAAISHWVSDIAMSGGK